MSLNLSLLTDMTFGSNVTNERFSLDQKNYCFAGRLAYQELVGGVLNMRTSHFQRLNGYSNLYWGWGAEDDDMAYRWVYEQVDLTRFNKSAIQAIAQKMAVDNEAVDLSRVHTYQYKCNLPLRDNCLFYYTSHTTVQRSH